jgi:hypothetical protein
VAKNKKIISDQLVFIDIFEQDRFSLITLLDANAKFSDTW